MSERKVSWREDGDRSLAESQPSCGRTAAPPARAAHLPGLPGPHAAAPPPLGAAAANGFCAPCFLCPSLTGWSYGDLEQNIGPLVGLSVADERHPNPGFGAGWGGEREP